MIAPYKQRGARFAALLASVALAGCATMAPKYERPVTPVSDSFPVGAAYGDVASTGEESAADSLHRQALFSPAAADTALTRTFSGRLARGMRNRLLREGTTLTPAPYPAQNWLMGELKRAAFAAGRSDLGSLWCGQAAPLLRHHHAAKLFADLVAQSEACLAA